MKILKATANDARTIREIALEANIDAWSETDYRAEIGREESYVLVAEEADALCGFLLARTVPGSSLNPDIDLYNIAVQPQKSRRGVGSALMAYLLSLIASTDIENIWLEVRESNTAAINFYEKHGFAAELTRPNFYANPSENGVIMRLNLRHSDDVNSR